jgi:endo-1,4-beta-xylanase
MSYNTCDDGLELYCEEAGSGTPLRAAGGLAMPHRRAVLAGLAGSMLAAPQASGQADAALRAIAAGRGLAYGSAVRMRALDDAPCAALLVRECGVVVPEHDLKWRALSRASGTYDFAAADRLMEFARRHAMAVRGHTLLWHRSIPAWLTSAASTAELERHIETHITTVVGRYAGRIRSWDVMNEAVDPASGRADGLRSSLFLDRLGLAYLERAYRAARAADPAVELVYNDYGAEHALSGPSHRKRDAIMDLLKRLLDRSVPLDALGVQGHLSTRRPFDGDQWLRWLEQVRALGLRIHVTELDVNDVASPADIAVRDAEVATLLQRFLESTLACAAVRSVLTWGLSDRYSWIVDGSEPHQRRADGAIARPLPYDRELQPKPARAALAAALASAAQR